MSDILHDPMTLYTVAFAIFIVLAWKHGRKPLLDWIDAEIARIRDQLEQAKALRAEAEATLADYKKKYNAAMAEAAAIVRHAEEEAVHLRAQAEAELKASLTRHEQQAAERIRLAENEAVAAVRGAIVAEALKLAEKTLAAQIDDAAASRLIDQAIADMPKLAATTAKAA
jgi:F-type H+-transporting ATPase subunit b